MQSDIPQCVHTRKGNCRCVRLPDGRFHLVRPGPLVHLFDGGHLLASELLAGVLRETCAHCLDLRRTELVQIAAGEVFGIYYEVIPRDEITPDDIDNVIGSGFYAWLGRGHLFVSPTVAEQMRQRGIDDISFSPGFSQFV